MSNELVWIDLEMTGLDVERHVVVEIATAITDAELNTIATGPNLVIHASEEDLSRMEPLVAKMHAASGLLEAIRSSRVSREMAKQETVRFLKAHLADDYQPPLCGNSVYADRLFLARQMPELEGIFHYRSIDVSSIKELCQRWYPDVFERRPKKSETHRALNDIVESIEELRYYRQAIFG